MLLETICARWSVINNEIDDDSNAPLGCSVGEFHEIAERTEGWIDTVII